MANVRIALRVIAIIIFVFGAFSFNPFGLQLVPLGLAFLTASFIP